MAKGALVLFSAGQDSATCLAWALTRFARVETIGFDYGQRHRIELSQRPLLRERIAALRLGGELGEDVVVDLTGYGALAESALTADRAIEMAESGLPTTFVPGRNLVFLAVAAAQAYRRGLDTLIGGMCETDYSGYPDCRRATIDKMQEAITLGLDRPVSIATPLMQRTKAATWELAQEIGGEALVKLIVEHSHTCYEGVRGELHAWGYGCGTCPACELRAKGYAAWRNAARGA